MRQRENPPKQYRDGVYDNSKQNIKQFVLILNEQGDEASYKSIHESVASQFAKSIIHEIKMSEQPGGACSSTSFIPDFWDKYVDLDMRAFDKTAGKI